MYKVSYSQIITLKGITENIKLFHFISWVSRQLWGSHDGAGQSSVPVLDYVMDHREGRGITERVDFLGESLHCGRPSLPAQHFIAGQLVLKLRERVRWEPANCPVTYNAILAAANICVVWRVEQIVRLVLQLLDIKFPGLLSAYQVGSVVGPPGYWEQSRLLNVTTF